MYGRSRESSFGATPNFCTAAGTNPRNTMPTPAYSSVATKAYHISCRRITPYITTAAANIETIAEKRIAGRRTCTSV
jgi:hypothetical protein